MGSKMGRAAKKRTRKEDADGKVDIVMVMVTHVDHLAWSDTLEKPEHHPVHQGQVPD